MTDHEIPQDSMPTLDVINSAYGEVLEHNFKRGSHNSLGNLIAAMIHADMQSDLTDDGVAVVNLDHDLEGAAEKLGSSVTEHDMQGDLQGILHEDTFMRIGIKLTPLPTQVMHMEGERMASAELEPVIENTQLFTNFLERQDPQTFQDNADNLALTTAVIKTLNRTIYTCYDKLPDDMSEEDKQLVREHGEDTLRTFTQIDEAYKRLGLDNPTAYQRILAEGQPEYLGKEYTQHREAGYYPKTYKRVEDYVTYWGRGVLPEFIATGASMEDLASEKSGYFDGDAAKLLTDKVDYIVDLTNAERTHEFGTEATTAMLAGIEATIKDAEDKPDAWFVSDETVALLKNLAVKLRAVIN